MRALCFAIVLGLTTSAHAVIVSGEFPVSSPRYVPLPSNLGLSVAVASNGQDFMATWVDRRSRTDSHTMLLMARITATGDVLDPLGVLLDPDQVSAPVIASSGSEYLIAVPRGPGIEIIRVSNDGEVVARHVLVMPVSNSIAVNSLVWSGNQFTLFWRTWGVHAPTVSYRSALSRDGQLLATPPTAEAATQSDIASNGTVVFRAALPMSKLTDLSGKVIRTVQLATVAAIQLSPAVAWNGRTFAVTWYELATNGCRIAQLTERGGALSGEGTVVPECAASPQTVASDGVDFLTAWAMGNDFLLTAAYAANGSLGAVRTVATSADRTLSSAPPGLAFDGAGYLLAWSSTRTVVDSGVLARRLTRDGQPVDRDAIRISKGDSPVASVVAAGESQYLVAWLSAQYPKSLYVRRISFGGVPLGEATRIDAVNAYGTALAVTARGDEFLVTWSQPDAGLTRGAVRAAIVRADGTIGSHTDTFRNPSSSSAVEVAATWNGLHYIVAGRGSMDGIDALYVARLSAAGALLDITQAGNGGSPALTTFARGRTMMVYERISHEPELGHVARIFGRFIEDPPRARAVR